jgi:hypothetical protein
MRRFVVLATLLLAGGVALGNGRPPVTNGITFRPGDAHSIYLRSTFGLLIAHDDCTFHWVCEQNVGYGGVFDPKYAVATDGTIFATTYKGLRVSRDQGCTFTSATDQLPMGDPNRIAETWIDSIDIATNGDVWVTTADSGKPNDVFRSLDNGVTFASANRHSPTIWWKSVKAAPSQPTRVYITGYEVAGAQPDGGLPAPKAHLSRTDDGVSWAESPLANVELGPTATTYVRAVSPTDPDTFFLVSEAAVNTVGDELYRSTDGGATLQKVFSSPNQRILDVVIVDDQRVLVALGAAGSFESTDGGATFHELGNWQDPQSRPPQLQCVGKRGSELFGCGANWVPDYKALAHSADGATWQKQFRFVEIAGPVDCPAGTPEHDLCEPLWDGSGGLQSQFGTTGPSATCSATGSTIPPDAAPAMTPGKTPAGCCDTGAAAAAATIHGMAVIIFALRRRRKKSCCS